LSNNNAKPVFLCVANWDSNVGYAWWLMESFWLKINDELEQDYRTIIAYPSISVIPPAIELSSIGKTEFKFNLESIKDIKSHYLFIKENNVRVIYFTDRPTSHWSYMVLKLLCGVNKIIIHDHTPGQRTKPTGIRRFLKKIRSRLAFWSADTAIGATEYVQRRLVEVNCFPVQHCYAAPNGLPPLPLIQHEPINIRRMLNLHENALIIVSTGRVDFYKGIEFALLVIARLVQQEQSRPIHYLYCGDGSDIDAARQLANNLNIGEAVTFLGKTDKIPQILAECDIAFHPSKGEVGYSLSVLEYMRSEVAVVLSDNPSVCEAITHKKTGLIYQEGNLESAVNAFQQLILDEPSRIQMGQQGKIAVQSNYSLSNTHDQLMNAIMSTLRKAG
jgi:glycosyltransferase involved in cell wall biosynthesis